MRGGRDCECLEVLKIVLLLISIPTVTARKCFRIVKAGLSEYCTASQKIISAVPPPLFRGEASVVVLFEGWCKRKTNRHIQMLALRKVSGIVRKISLMVRMGQSLRLDGRKVWRIKKADVSQVKRNKATVCALPSIHLPLTREASVIVLFEG